MSKQSVPLREGERSAQGLNHSQPVRPLAVCRRTCELERRCRGGSVVGEPEPTHETSDEPTQARELLSERAHGRPLTYHDAVVGQHRRGSCPRARTGTPRTPTEATARRARRWRRPPKRSRPRRTAPRRSDGYTLPGEGGGSARSRRTPRRRRTSILCLFPTVVRGSFEEGSRMGSSRVTPRRRLDLISVSGPRRPPRRRTAAARVTTTSRRRHRSSTPARGARQPAAAARPSSML